jgi:hypothetical protein
VSHDTDLRGAEKIAKAAQADLAEVLYELAGRAVSARATGETVLNVFRELIAATRRNDALTRARRALTRELGPAASGLKVRAILESVQADARLAPTVPPPAGAPALNAIAGRSTIGEDDATPAYGQPVHAREPGPSESGVHRVQGPWRKS